MSSADLASALRSYRTQQAAALSQPAYCNLTNSELDALVAACPQSSGALSRIRGFGASKLAKFGDDIVRICSSGLAILPTAAPTALSNVGSPKRKLPPGFSGGGSSSAAARPATQALVPPLPPQQPIARSALNSEQ